VSARTRRDATSAAGFNIDAINGIIDTYAVAPKDIPTSLTLGTTSVEAGIARVKTHFTDIESTTSTVSIVFDTKQAAQNYADYLNAVKQTSL
jgi:hypothetical protein